jgi:hypothetical protein
MKAALFCTKQVKSKRKPLLPVTSLLLRFLGNGEEIKSKGVPHIFLGDLINKACSSKLDILYW